jgi:hypothetical protein
MPSLIDPIILAERNRALELAKSAAEIERLYSRWAVEDDQLIRARALKDTEVEDLTRRVAALEHLFGRDGQRLLNPLLPLALAAVGPAHQARGGLNP